MSEIKEGLIEIMNKENIILNGRRTSYRVIDKRDPNNVITGLMMVPKCDASDEECVNWYLYKSY